MSTAVKMFHSAMTGAPVIGASSAGLAIGVLDACLVNGFGLKTLDSLVVAAGVATGNVTTGHPYEVGSVIVVAGATPAGLNGQFRVTWVNATDFKFDATGVANGTATGTITAKLAPLGWAKSYSGSNKAAYKSQEPAATACYLRVDDSDAYNSRVAGYESMSDIDTGTGPFPTSAQVTGGGAGYWAKANSPTGNRPWVVVGDERSFYLCIAPHGSTYANAFHIYFFGDIVSNKAGDAYGCMISCFNYDRSAGVNIPEGCVGYSERSVSNEGKFLARPHTQIGSSRSALVVGAGHIGTSGSLHSGRANYSLSDFPNNSDNGLLLCQALIIADKGVRGSLPGLWHVTQNTNGFFAHRSIIDGGGPLSGRKVMMVTPGATSSDAPGLAAFDVSGPWR